MPRLNGRKLLIAVSLMVGMIFLASGRVAAQSADQWFGDEHLQVYIAIDGKSLTDASEISPVVIDLENPVLLELQVRVVGTQAIYNLTGSIGFYYQGIQIISIAVQQNFTHGIPPNTTIPVAAYVDFGAMLRSEYVGIDIDLVKGTFEASIDFSYYLEGEVIGVDDPHTFSYPFYFNIPAGDILDVITSVAGAAATVATVGAIAGTGTNLKALLDGIQTAHKIRSIQKKSEEIRSLPDLTVIGATASLFSLVKGMKLREKGKTDDAEGDQVSEYLLKQRLREVAPEAWPMKKCPGCKRKWNRRDNYCKKCNFDEEQARREYAEVLVAKVPKALKVMNKKKNLSIKKLSKKTKSNQYNAGVIGLAMVDTDLTEITKIETPLRGFVMNIAGLAFLILTWQQLLGGAASQWQTTLTIVGGALSVAVIIALYFARKTQVEKFQLAMDEGRPLLPTSVERMGAIRVNGDNGDFDGENADEISSPSSEEIEDEDFEEISDSDMPETDHESENDNSGQSPT